MNNEIEAQFLYIHKSAIRKQLKAIGAKLIKPEILMHVQFSLRANILSLASATKATKSL